MRNRFFLLGDLLLIPLAAFGAFALRFDLHFYQAHHDFLFYVTLALAIKPLTFLAFGLYQRWWRYATVADLIAVVAAVLVSSVALAVAVAFALWLRPHLEVSRAVLLIDALLTLVCIGAFRMSVRILTEGWAPARPLSQRSAQKRVLVVGAGAAGVMVVRELQRNPQLGMVPIGFLDDDPVKLRKRINGLKVLGDLEALVDVSRLHGPDEV
ncbi:MAG: nucleoside-diphosphate sugar epimerase/dehydratase, partial [Vicinamibacterales bacterium]